MDCGDCCGGFDRTSPIQLHRDCDVTPQHPYNKAKTPGPRVRSHNPEVVGSNPAPATICPLGSSRFRGVRAFRPGRCSAASVGYCDPPSVPGRCVQPRRPSRSGASDSSRGLWVRSGLPRVCPARSDTRAMRREAGATESPPRRAAAAISSFQECRHCCSIRGSAGSIRTGSHFADLRGQHDRER